MTQEKANKIWKKAGRWLAWLVVFILLFPVLVTAVLHIPVVQQWVSGKVTNYLSDKIEAKVTLSRIDLSIFKGVSLSDFAIQQMEGDTLLAVDRLEVNLSKNLFSLFRKRLEINSISLVNPRISAEVDPKDGKINLLKLLEKLSSPSSSSSKDPIVINLKEFYVKKLNFTLLDEPRQVNLIARLEEGKINFKRFDIKNLVFDVGDLNLIKPEFQRLDFGSEISYVKKDKKTTVSNTAQLCVTIKALNILDGIVNLDKRLQSTGNEAFLFNPDHIAFHHINLDIDNLSFGGIEDVYAKINNLAFESPSGFVLQKMEVPSLIINHQMLSLEEFYIKTGNSTLGNKVVLKFKGIESFADFANKVVIDADFSEGLISLKELGYFIPAFASSDFYRSYSNKSLELDGKLKGRLANIKGAGLTVRLEDKLFFAGDFGARNLQDPGEMLLNLRVQKLLTNISFIGDVIPGFNPPANFYQLGRVDFNGNFDGYLNDFVAFGKLNTEIGHADLDLRLDVKKGNDKAKYAGNLVLTDFDLGKWSNNANLGKVSFKAKIKDGESLIFKNAKAELEAVVERLEFKNYNYNKINVKGSLASNAFNGSLISADKNIDFNFKGSLAFDKPLPYFNFDAKVNNLNLQALNLSKDIRKIGGHLVIQGEGNSLNTLLGKITGDSVLIIRNDTLYDLGKVTFIAEQNKGKNRSLDFSSEMANLNLQGVYDLNTVVKDIQYLVKNNFPYHTRSLEFSATTLQNIQNFTFDAELFEARKLFGLIGLKNMDLHHFKAKGAVNSEKRELSFVSNLPLLKVNDLTFHNVQLMANNTGNTGDFLLHLDSAFVSGKKLNAVEIQSVMKGDDVQFKIDASKIVDSIQNFQLTGTLSPHEKGYTVSITDNDIRLFQKRWKINNESKLSFGSKFIDLENVTITDGVRFLEVGDVMNKGLAVNIVKLDVASINPIIKYDKILMGGELNSTLKVSDIFNPSPSITGTVNIPSFLMNNDSYGELTIDVGKEEGKPMEVLLSLSRATDGMALKVNGEYNFDTKLLDAEVKGKKVSLKFLEYILKAGIRDVKGYVDIDADVNGKLPEIKIDGKGKAFGGQLEVIYLGETYYFDNQDFEITESYIDLTGAKLTDSEGNPGFIEGTLTHKLFKDFYLNASIRGDNVIAINTSKFDNPVYYGIGRGQVSVDFSGSVNTPKMVINAITKPGTVINIPIKESRSSADQSFISFIDKEKFLAQNDDSLSISQDVKVEGISIEMNLTMTQDAVVNMIFDEFKNDIITGVGNGNLRISMSNRGEFDMFGVYTIARGNYLFTAFNFVNKPFLVREGGTIRWTGDPINATLNIEADYAVKTPLTSFLTEYLVTDQLVNAAAVSTAVNLKLILGNTLFNPSVKFDFEFPNLTGELKSYTDSKIRLLRNNESDYNSQVFGLIVFNSFIPSNTISDVVTNNNFIQSAGISTLSEFVSSQLSMFVTGLVNEALEDNGLISGIDFDIDLRNNSTFQSVTGNNSLLPTEIEVKLKNKFRFLDERLSINVGGNYVRQNSIINLNNYIVPEFFIEYALTKDRQLNLKLYGKYDLDEISLTSRRQKFGLGLRYKNEFGSMVETRTKLSDGFKKLLETQKK
ncbi:MAG: translocation/assembly module TamB domain-containing protein [Saprospiraceae bacterium]|nr:translocation/assembly module TamB domain-containing protein [Saprospiraceae bacterium]